MRYRFAFGIGRSGTTLLGRLLALTSSPARFVSELCPGIANQFLNPRFMVEPGSLATVARIRDSIVGLGSGKSPFFEDQAYRIERNDPDAEVLLIKDIHSLLAYREIVSDLGNWRGVVILRDTSRTLDSYFHGHKPEQRRYLIEEYDFLERFLADGRHDELIENALSALPVAVVRYFRRPRMFTSELFRQAAVTEFMRHFLEAWVAADYRLTSISFEDLCWDPLAETLRVFEFLELEHDDSTLAEIQRTTSGSGTEYYATDKDSRSIRCQPYKYFGSRDLRRLKAFLGHAQSKSIGRMR